MHVGVAGGVQPLLAQGVDFGVIKRVERPEHGGEKVVGQRRVAGQDRPVQVGAHHPAVDDALRAVAPVVAVADDHPAQGLGVGTEGGDAAVVLVPGEVGEVEGGVGRDHDLAHPAGAVVAVGLAVEQAQALSLIHI